MKKLFIILVIILIGFNDLFSQDTIVKRDNERIVCKVKEVATDEIKYQTLDNDIILGIDKNDVSQIVFSNGLVMNFQKSMDNADNYKEQRKNAVKFRLLSPLYGYSDIAFERSLKPGASIECSIGLIGLGKQIITNDVLGASVRVGYKFIMTPDFYLKGLQYAHVLNGFYIRPEIATSIYKRNSNNIYSMALLINIGKQWVLNNIMVVDWFVGIGYGYSSDDSFDIQYGYMTGARDFPIALSSGFRVGFLIK